MDFPLTTPFRALHNISTVSITLSLFVLIHRSIHCHRLLLTVSFSAHILPLEVTPLDRLTSPAPLHLCSVSIYPLSVAFWLSYLVSLRSLPFVSVFPSRFPPACRFPPRTESINSFTFLTPFASLSSLPRICRRSHTHPKSYRLSHLTSLAPQYPHGPHHCTFSRIPFLATADTRLPIPPFPTP